METSLFATMIPCHKLIIFLDTLFIGVPKNTLNDQILLFLTTP